MAQNAVMRVNYVYRRALEYNSALVWEGNRKVLSVCENEKRKN